MSSSAHQSILALSAVDRKILSLRSRRSEVRDYLAERLRRIGAERERVVKFEATLQGQALRQQEDESRLRDEEQKIVLRRKQLTAIGGAKGAKMVEREIDISTRSIQTLEERVLKDLESVEATNNALESARAELVALEEAFASERPQLESSLQDAEERLERLLAEREALLPQLGADLLRLYERVRTRYAGDPIASVANASCQGCFRSLPTNLYHHVLAGEIGLQCPGCSRILVGEPAAS